MKTFWEWLNENTLRKEFPARDTTGQDAVNNLLVAADKAEDDGKFTEWLRMAIGWFKSQVRSLMADATDPSILQPLLDNNIFRDVLFGYRYRNDEAEDKIKELFEFIRNTLINAIAINKNLAPRINEFRIAVNNLETKFKQFFNVTPHANLIDIGNEIKPIIARLKQEISFSELGLLLDEVLKIFQKYLGLPTGLLRSLSEKGKNKDALVDFQRMIKEMREAISQNNISDFEKKLDEMGKWNHETPNVPPIAFYLYYAIWRAGAKLI
jgi:hypothetical protein